MTIVGTTQVRFVPTAGDLDEFFARYEDERRRHGIASTFVRISPQQRIDAIVAMLGLNASGGWNRRNEENAEDLWLRYLAPVLAETRQSVLALQSTVSAGLPGAFTPPFAAHVVSEIEEPQVSWDEPEPGPKPRRPRWQRRLALARVQGMELVEDLALHLLRHRITAGLATILLVAGIAAASFSLGQNKEDGTIVREPFPVPGSCLRCVAAINELDFPTADPAAEAYRETLTLTLDAVTQDNGEITPRELAEIYAGESRVMGEPALVLAALYREWPWPPDMALPHDRSGAYALTRYAETFTAMEERRSVSTARTPLDRDTDQDQDLRQRLMDFVLADAAQATPASQSGSSWWTAYLRLLTLLPVIPVYFWLQRRMLPALKAQLTNPLIPQQGVAVELPVTALLLTAPLPARRLARQIAWREPGIARRIHQEASVRATIRRGGYFTLVPRLRPRPADYLFLVPRRHVDDHERDRVNRFIDALRRGGLSLTVYDYDPDPRTLYPHMSGGNDKSDQRPTAMEPQATLDLRALRELHSDARLVLVTEGTELVDYFTQRALPFVAEELASWPRRMLLTPVPMAEWGEREMNIAEAMQAVIGRATPDGFQDLVMAFGEHPRDPPRAARLTDAEEHGDRGLIARLNVWLDSQEQFLDSHRSIGRRPATVRFDDPMLYSDAPPPPEDQAALVRELREWLGSRGFVWLVACAAYPQLRFAITLYLGLTIIVDRGPVRECLYSDHLLAQLTLLPWFRIGRMPPWLRRALLHALPTLGQDRIRKAVADMLADPSKADLAGLSKEALLTIWLPDQLGANAPPDAVMADMMFRDMADLSPVLQGSAFATVFRGALIEARRQRNLVLGTVALWCAMACWLFPALDNPPIAAGVWLPLFGFVGVTAVVAMLLRFGRHLRFPKLFGRTRREARI